MQNRLDWCAYRRRFLCANGVEHPLPLTIVEELVGGQDVAFHIGIDAAFTEISIVTSDQGIVRAPVLGHLHIVDTATGPGQKDHVRVQPVDIEIIPVEALAGPQGGVLEHRITLEGGDVVEFGKYLTHVQFAFGSRPVVIALNAIGDGDGELGTCAVLRIDFFRQIEAHVGVVFVTQTPDCSTDRTCGVV